MPEPYPKPIRAESGLGQSLCSLFIFPKGRKMLIVKFRYNSHTIKFTFLKFVIHGVLVYLQNMKPSIPSNFRAFLSSQKETPYLSVVIPHSFLLASSCQPLICSLFLQILLFQACHMNGIIQYVGFVSLYMIFLRFIYVEAFISTSFLFMAE